MKKTGLYLTAIAALAVPAFAVLNSGINVGQQVSAFHPKHVAGPHKGTDACPPCTYGMLPQVQVWINGDSEANIAQIAKVLNNRSEWQGQGLKSFVIFVSDPAKTAQTAKWIESIASKTGYSKVAMAYLPKNSEFVADYKINTSPEVKNTVFVYKNRTVQAKFVNLKADANGLAELNKAIDKITK